MFVYYSTCDDDNEYNYKNERIEQIELIFWTTVTLLLY